MQYLLNYVVFDSEELLEASILSIRKDSDYICVVYQTISNWGNKTSNPHLEDFLQDLRSRKLVDELVFYEPKVYSLQVKTSMISSRVSEQEIGGPAETIGDVFFNELAKREIGRLKCKDNGNVITN